MASANISNCNYFSAMLSILVLALRLTSGMLLIYLDEQALSETERRECCVESTQLEQELHSSGTSSRPVAPIAHDAASVHRSRTLHAVTRKRLVWTPLSLVVGLQTSRSISVGGRIMRMPIVKTATPSDKGPAIDVVILAFSADPAARWTWPDPQQYLAHFPGFVQAFGGKAFTNGSAYYVDGYAGAALWLPPDVHADEDALITLLQRTVAERIQKDAFAVFEQMGHYHPSEPHWYLPLIGVDPFQQGKGYGSALMQHALIPCDRDHKLAYLESTNPRNIALYERHGFKVLGTVQVGKSPPIVPMLRQPR
jgi:ribosomal protein S18 acetylase RimI-like enzyme